MEITCPKCGVKQGLLAVWTADLGTGQNLCSKCADENQKEVLQKAADEAKRVQEVKRAAQQVIVTTTPKVDGFYVARYIGIESVEFVIGTAVFSEMSSSFADFFGARSTAFESKLQTAKKHALAALKYVAAEQGANAVVGVDIDYTEFSGNRVALIINGTLVQLAPNPPRKSIAQAMGQGSQPQDVRLRMLAYQRGKKISTVANEVLDKALPRWTLERTE